MSKEKPALDFVLRALAGMIIHVVLIMAALFNIEITYELVMKFYVDNKDSIFPARAIASVFSASIFLSMLAGAYWVKSTFIHHFLPEVAEDK